MVHTLVEAWQRSRRAHLGFIAAGLAYYGILALVPGLIALVSVYGIVADASDVTSLIDALGDTTPAEVLDFLRAQLNDIVDSPSGGLGLGAAVSIAAALWASSAGTRSLIRGVNIAFGATEVRNAAQLRIISIGITLGIVVFVVAALFLSGFGGIVSDVLAWLRWPLLFASTVTGLAVLYRHAPSHLEPRWSYCWAGAGIAAAAWLGASYGLSLYLSRVGGLNETYGTLGTVVATMLWLFLSGYVVLIGATVTASLET